MLTRKCYLHEYVVFCRDNASDTSSISQSSYDPSQPMFAGVSAEIADTVAMSTEDTGNNGIVLISNKSKGSDGTLHLIG